MWISAAVGRSKTKKRTKPPRSERSRRSLMPSRKILGIEICLHALPFGVAQRAVVNQDLRDLTREVGIVVVPAAQVTEALTERDRRAIARLDELESPVHMERFCWSVLRSHGDRKRAPDRSLAGDRRKIVFLPGAEPILHVRLKRTQVD